MAVKYFTTKDGSRLVVSVFPATAGLVSGFYPQFVPPDASVLEDNMIQTIKGSRRTRPPILPYNTDIPVVTSRVKGLFDSIRLLSPASHKVVGYVGNKFIGNNNAEGPFVTIGSTPTAGDSVTIDSLVGLTFFGVKGNGLFSYDHSSGPTLVADAPVGAWIVRKHKNSMYAAGADGAPELLFKSDNTNPLLWTSGNAEEINIDSGSADLKGITGIFPDLKGPLYIGKYNTIYELDTSQSPAPLRPLRGAVGVLSHNTIQTIGPSDALFASYRGLHSIQVTQQYADVQDVFISNSVNDLWITEMDLSQPESFYASFSPTWGCYFMCYPSKTADTYNLLGYCPSTSAFFHWRDTDLSCVTQAFLPPDFRQYTVFGKTDGNVVVLGMPEHENFLDSGSDPYSSSFTTPPIFPAQVPGPNFTFTNLTIYLMPRGVENLTVFYKVGDSAEIPLTLNQANLTTIGDFVEVTFPLSGLGTCIQLRFDVQSGQPNMSAAMEVIGYNIYAIPAAERWQPMMLGNSNG